MTTGCASLVSRVAGLTAGSCHPALIFARLHGERLGDWATTAEVAEGVLRIEGFNALFRAEAFRLLGCAQAALGRSGEACQAAESAAAEAAKARYVWIEMLSLRDALRWCEVDAVEHIRSRLRDAVSRVSASDGAGCVWERYRCNIRCEVLATAAQIQPGCNLAYLQGTS